MKKITFLLLFFGFLGFSQSQKDSVAVPLDHNSVLTERASIENLNEKYNGEAFNYDIKTGESQNLLARFFNWLGRWLSDTFGIETPPGTMNVIKWIIYIAMGCLIIYLIVKLLANERFDAIFSKKAKTLVDLELSKQHIEQVNFDHLLAGALKNKDYRLAIRYHFLKLLKKLSYKEIIVWHFEKTNTDYHREIKEPSLQSGFKDLSYLYDYVWYGEQQIDETSYERASKKFDHMNQLILD